MSRDEEKSELTKYLINKHNADNKDHSYLLDLVDEVYKFLNERNCKNCRYYKYDSDVSEIGNCKVFSMYVKADQFCSNWEKSRQPFKQRNTN